MTNEELLTQLTAYIDLRFGQALDKLDDLLLNLLTHRREIGDTIAAMEASFNAVLTSIGSGVAGVDAAVTANADDIAAVTSGQATLQTAVDAVQTAVAAVQATIDGLDITPPDNSEVMLRFEDVMFALDGANADIDTLLTRVPEPPI